MSKTKAKKAKIISPIIPLDVTGWLNRRRVKLKLKAPSGVKLSHGETEALIDIQEEDIQVLKENEKEVLAAISVTQTVQVGRQIKKAQNARSIALTSYKNTKDPIKKREWARRLVVADTTRTSLVDMTNRMNAARDRLMMIRGDIELQIVEAEARVAETTAYASAGKQLQLAGESLVSARTRAKSNAIEYTNLEVSMEGAEKLVNQTDAKEILAQADKIAGIK